MTRIILNGCNGRMGRVIIDKVAQRDDCEIAAGVDVTANEIAAFPLFTSISDCYVEAGVIIDFSNPNGLGELLQHAMRTSTPLVIATTGLSPRQVEYIKTAALEIPVFFTANMSIGVNLLAELAKKAAAILGGEFDIEIVEKHHNQKLDAPSGTALLLADEIASALPETPFYMYNRHSQRKKRDKDEIGIHSVRGGTIPGDHEIIFAGMDEVITLSHSALSRSIFAAGAINAAMFIENQPKGLYSMKDLLSI